ncbi:ribosomal RNA small subunit methyltransferase NEP1-like [Herrania umbratica]|uniref:Ribosomal RNA small subunit methyltransferase NEP1-like n=1 Tax=Herrania umbratica TaxID=108875 RepID=A0A6J1AMJ5_9ROSI|nr:ribosomal RNA small subunit methyltransferase NEP1-like [Herrania umbratica]
MQQVNDVPLEPPSSLGASAEQEDNVISTHDSQGSTSIDLGASGNRTSSRSRKRKLLNSDEDDNFLRKQGKNLDDYWPDIILELGSITDSRLCKSGRKQAVYVKTDEGVLIKVEPNTQIPRTPQRFRNMMELLQKFSVKAANEHGKLLRLVENPVTQHLPANSHKIGLSYSSNKLVCLKDYVGGISDDENLVFVVGAMAHGKTDADYVDDLISGYAFSIMFVIIKRFMLEHACSSFPTFFSGF